MYIASIRIHNFRCFQDTTIDFQPGLNVIIGENNARQDDGIASTDARV